MKKLLTIALGLCAVIVALACGSNDPKVDGTFPNATILESLGISGSQVRNESSKQTVENWLKRLGVDKQSTGVKAARTRTADIGRKYALNGQPTSGKSGIYIQGNKKYMNK